jgi:hypothetical protein
MEHGQANAKVSSSSKKDPRLFASTTAERRKQCLEIGGKFDPVWSAHQLPARDAEPGDPHVAQQVDQSLRRRLFGKCEEPHRGVLVRTDLKPVVFVADPALRVARGTVGAPGHGEVMPVAHRARGRRRAGPAGRRDGATAA